MAIGSKIQSQVQSELDSGQREYFLRQQLKAIQEELGESDEVQTEIAELRAQLDEQELPEEVRKQADRELDRLSRLQPAMAEYGVIRGYLEWIAALPWSRATEDNLDLGHARDGARRGPLRHRAGQGPDPGVPRRPLAEARRPRLDPVLRRSARGRQDLARPLDRPRARPAVRADQRRRGARRVGDPRPPADVHRRDAGDDHPRDARRGCTQPAADDRRDRQDGRGLPGRSVERDARGARSRAERRASATTTSTFRSRSPR